MHAKARAEWPVNTPNKMMGEVVGCRVAEWIHAIKCGEHNLAKSEGEKPYTSKQLSASEGQPHPLPCLLLMCRKPIITMIWERS